jgi:RNA-directed DNA polymerase
MQIAKVQESLARKALYQPNTRCDNLFSLVVHPYWLWVATESVLQSESASIAGVDGIGKKQLAGDTHAYAQALSAQLKAGSYRPQPVKHQYVLQADGQLRSVGIATLRDLVVQEAIRMVLEPILESHFLNCSTGLRPGRRVMDAIHLIEYFASNNVKMWWLIEGYIQGGFDAFPHRKLLGIFEQYIDDKKLVSLLASLLSAGIHEKGKVATPDHGVTQAGLLAPLLLNVYLHEMDKTWWERYGSLTEGQKTYRRAKGLGNVQLVRYADSFVVLTNGDKAFAHELHAEFADVLQALGLELSEERTRVTHLNDGLDFLGFHLQRVHSTMSNKNMLLVKPTQQNIDRFKEAMRAITSRETAADDVPNKIRAVNSLVRQWAGYYRYVNVSDEFNELERFVHMRLYYWLKAKHSNLSATQSIGKYVLSTYLAQFTPTRKTWGMHGVKLIPMSTIDRKRYHIRWPKERNPYLEPGKTQMRIRDEVPIPEAAHLWRGHTEQSAYSVARLERLELVGHKCEECGSSSGYLHAHHVVPQRENGRHTVDNLRILCESCHIKTYSGK